ncbi:hypothetical protein Tco_1576437 [Tanacetum coccineum]
MKGFAPRLMDQEINERLEDPASGRSLNGKCHLQREIEIRCYQRHWGARCENRNASRKDHFKYSKEKEATERASLRQNERRQRRELE